jgi:hypothetical protein
MRYKNGVAVLLPWLDSNNNRNHTRFTFTGDVDRRRVRRQLRRAMKSGTGISAPKWWLNHYLKHRSYVPGNAAA